ncbi:MAG: hypothetical protein ACR2PL_17795 [Dehalococcoidia bacterium]
MIKTVVLIPILDNDGNPFPLSLVREFERRLLRFGGLSRLSGFVGTWEFQGRIYHEPNHQYTVALRSWWDLAAWLDIVMWAKAAFGQEAIYIEVAGVPEIRGEIGPHSAPA